MAPCKSWARSLSLALLFALALTSERVRAEDAQQLQAIADRIAGQAAQAGSVPGLIVGVSLHGKRSFYGYSGTGDMPPTSRTIIEIGSITKVFTTALFAEAIAEGRMRADAPIQSYIGRRLQPCAAQVTPLELADFSSGMPTLPNNLPRELRNRGIENYTRDDFMRWIAGWSPGNGFGCDLPAGYRYSNAGVGLLGYLVADQLGLPWADLVRERITGPLGMGSTSVRVADENRDRLARGHLADGADAIPWPVFAWFAAGALRSTASDMLSFGEAALGHETVEGHRVPPQLRDAFAKATQPIYQPENQSVMIAMSWVVDPGDPDEGTHRIIYKDGGTDGFRSVIVINPSKDLAVFVAGNQASLTAQRVGVRLTRMIP